MAARPGRGVRPALSWLMVIGLGVVLFTLWALMDNRD